MCLNTLFPTVKTVALYHVPIKSYSKNTHGSSILKWILVGNKKLTSINNNHNINRELNKINWEYKTNPELNKINL